MKAGMPASGTVPVVYGREGLLRVFVTPRSTWTARELSFQLELGGLMPATLEVKKTISAPSTEADLASTVNFEVPGAHLLGGATWRVSAREVLSGPAVGNDSDGAIYPADPALLTGEDTGEKLLITIVPVKYNADGSGRLPDTSAAQLERYRNLFYALYPAREVEVTVGNEFPWSSQVAPNGGGWSQLLQAILQRRQADGVPDNVYYYGAFCPTSSMAQFCGGGGCVLGLSSGSGDPRDDFVRGSIGLGWGGSAGDDTVETAVHELGHAHGRDHAPCMLFGQPSDPRYPHPGAEIGVWGYDLVGKRLIDPSGDERDMMGYCKPLWISDYTYNALIDRVAAVNARARMAPTAPTSYRMHTVSDGGLEAGATVTLTHQPGGEPREVELLDAAGRPTGERATGWYYPFDHLPGGLLLLAEEGAPRRARLAQRLR